MGADALVTVDVVRRMAGEYACKHDANDV